MELKMTHQDFALHFIDDRELEIGFTLSPVAQGRGLAKKALSELLKTIFLALKKDYVLARTDMRNERAIKLLRKTGFKCEKKLAVENPYDESSEEQDFVFGLGVADWLLANFSGWHFGGKGSGLEDELLSLVLEGKKTATCFWAEAAEHEGEAIAQQGEQFFVMDSNDRPRCLLEITNIVKTPFLQVSHNFARQEGEGDLSFACWRIAHEQFFAKEGVELGLKWDANKCHVYCLNFKILRGIDI